jgi:hypothetical protein
MDAGRTDDTPLSAEDLARVEKLVELLKDRDWRLRNLYWIVDKNGNKVRFNPNRTQRRLLAKLAKRNLVLKSRQHGITTLMCLVALDTCLFRSNTSAGIVAHKKEDAEKFFRGKVLYAYENLPAWLQALRPIVRKDMNGELEFGNGSKISVSLSHRGGTLQFLHVAEYGPLCAQFPARAHEVKTGAFNALAPDGIGTIESTAMGMQGDFYDKTQRAIQLDSMVKSGTAKHSDQDYHFFFFAWWEDDTNEIDPDGVVIPAEQHKYFDDLERDHGVPKLSPRKRAWYSKKAEEQGDDMKREHPSTPQEAFEQSVEGAYYSKELALAERQGRILDLPIMPGIPVNTFWDLGKNDTTAIWFHQKVGMWHHFVDYYENANEGGAHYVRKLIEKGYIYGTHYLPHDGEVSEYMMEGKETRRDRLEKLLSGHGTVVTVPVIEDIKDGIDMVQHALILARFDRTRCGETKPGSGRGGLPSLRNYRKEWNEKLSTWHDHPLHNWASNGADALRQWAQGYPMADINDAETRAALSGKRRRNRRGGGMTA